jgi:pSer/pThr/pTyr-binding forkhead associated (FHA) protein
VTACAFCGRDNEPASRYCIDCGKPISAPAARAVPAYFPPEPPGGTMLRQASGQERSGSTPLLSPSHQLGVATTTCPRCSKTVDAALPFCGYCGTRVSAIVSVGTAKRGGVVVSVLDDDLSVETRYSLDRGEAVIGRGDADIKLDDVYLSPLHARLELRDGVLWVRDLGSRNGTWTYVEEPTRLADGDVILVGSQLLRFRRLGYPGPHPPEADSTRRMGSLTPPADVAVLEQLRADGSVRDCFHLSPTRTVQLGRESGDWVFPYDQTMSGRHAEIQSQDADFYLVDSGSRNGIALAVRGERVVRKGQRILLGDQILRIESVE